MLDSNGLCSDSAALAEKVKSKLVISPALDKEAFAYSQPTDLRVDMETEEHYHPHDRIMSFSQPAAYLGGESQSPEKLKFDIVYNLAKFRIPKGNEERLRIYFHLRVLRDSFHHLLVKKSLKGYLLLFKTFWYHARCKGLQRY
jgi:hypothetical protein